MITIISGTNRADSRTIQIANYYYEVIKKHTDNVHLISLMDNDVTKRDANLIKLEENILIPSDKFIFIMPEYNGSFPGILKLFLDNSDIRKVWFHKKAALVGLGIGRGGNLRGLDHMASILNYLKVNVLYNKLPISLVHEHMDIDGIIQNEQILKSIEDQIIEFINF